MRLELDVGNTRIKWRISDALGDILDHGLDLKQAILGGQNKVLLSATTIWVSSVSSEASRWIKQHFPEAKFAATQQQQFGLHNSYTDIARMGVDRWLAMLAAWCKQPNDQHIVIDAGTALTIDIIERDGQHGGGYICPGLFTMKSGLLGKTENISTTLEWESGRAPGKSTQNCVDHGILDMAVSWMESIVAERPKSVVWITGGDAKEVVQLLPSSVLYQPDLVLDGLNAYFKGGANKSHSVDNYFLENNSFEEKE